MSKEPTSFALRWPAAWLLLIGFLFHATYLLSIFDIYFVSPVVRANQRFSVLDNIPGEPPSARAEVKPLANRVVLIVGDGLRADKLFSLFPNPPFDPPHPPPAVADLKTTPRNKFNSTCHMSPAPYIRSLIETGKASWGISHTRVPTESRPGHVALIAGMYEDVSAVTRGWKMNPVNFDSVFNQSSHSFTFGSPDILPMFKYGASDPSRVDAWSYNEEAEDFTKDAAQLDLWVLDRLKQLLSDARQAGPGSLIDRQLRSDQVFFFLHLLGLDTTGHSYRPHSPEYLRNIQVVDRVVQRTQELLEDFYGDSRTAYIFTADHGMSNIGNHGDGDPDNTRTPIVAWGSGIREHSDTGNFPADSSSLLDPYYRDWGFDMSQRKDIDQADIAALMAALSGVRVPSNSVGRLPLNYLNTSDGEMARAAYANTREILHQYEVKLHLKASHKFHFSPFPDLPEQESLSKPTVLERLFYIHRLILTGRDAEAIKACEDLQALALQGLKYLQRYDWFLLRTIVVSGYVGWILYCAVFVLRTYTLPAAVDRSGTIGFGSATGFIVFTAMSLWFYFERAPITYYLYVLFPAYFWSRVVDNLDSWQELIEWSSKNKTPGSNPWVTFLVTLFSLECMVLGYFHRIAWTFGWIVIGVAWPMFGVPSLFRKSHPTLMKSWTWASLGSSLFTLLPVEKGESLLVITLGSILLLCAGYVARSLKFSKPSHVQLGVVMITLFITLHSALKLRQKVGLPVFNQFLSWMILVCSSLAPLLPKKLAASQHSTGSPLTNRLIDIIFSYAPAFILLSMSYEVLFYLSFSVSLLVWLNMETRLAAFNRVMMANNKAQGNSKNRPMLKLHHSRLTLFFLFFVHVGFFGTGNIASLSSFYLEPVYRLVPIFNPFLMSSLLVLKILVPFLIVSAVFTSLNTQLGLPGFTLFISSLVISDILTLNFFFLVNDHGSWLEIGQSISHFAIASLFLVFLILLHFIGEFLLSSVVEEQPERVVEKEQ